MSTATFVHVSLFEDASPEAQLRCLASFVMEEGTVVGQDVDRFNDRLQRYARKAGITLEQAKQNVRSKCEGKFNTQLGSFGLV